MKVPGVKQKDPFARDQAHAVYLAMLDAIDATGQYPMFRRDVIEECGKAFERFLEKHYLPKKASKKRVR